MAASLSFISSINQQCTEALFRWIQWGLDERGAWDWNLRHVAVATAVFLGFIRLTLGKKAGIDWYALLHALITSIGSCVCVYLSLQSEPPTDAMRAITCQGPLTSLHRILPAITMGYSIFDLVDGFFIGYDFMFHGAGTFALMAFFCELGQPQLVTPMLLMEVSTCFLTVVRADFVSSTVSMLIQAGFVLNFFLFRICVVPYLWLQLAITMWEHRNDYVACFPMHIVVPAVLIFGTFFHGLNAFWFYKIVRKIQRKIAGVEKIQENNDLGERELQSAQDDEPIKLNGTAAKYANGTSNGTAKKPEQKKKE